jgi:signal transduction histidine kinase
VSEGRKMVFEATWDQAVRTLSPESIAIAVHGPGSNQLTYELVVERGNRQPTHTRELGDGLSDLVLRTKRPLLVGEFEQEDGSLPLTWMGAPMMNGDVVLGLISVQRAQPRGYDRRDLSLLGALANWTASELESARLRQQMQQDAESSAAILGFARSLSRETQREATLKLVAAVVPAVIAGVRCAVWLGMEENGRPELVWRSDVGASTAAPLDPQFSEARHAPGVLEMVGTRDVVLVPDGERWRLGALGACSVLDGSDVALVPLTAGNQVVAVAAVSRPRGSGGFTREDIELLRGVSDVASLSLSRQPQGEPNETVAKDGMDDLKSRLITTISHEVRTPLSMITTGTELLMGKLQQPEQLRQVAELVNQGSSRLAEVVDDLIEYAEMQARAIVPSPEESCACTIAREAIMEVTDETNAHRVTLEISEPLPRIRVDAGKLKSVIGRLVKNGVSFSEEPSKVVVRLSVISERLRVEVSDGGFGIPAEERELVFRPFFRGEISQSRSVSGTGLGLTIVRQLVEAMGGDIELRSQPEKGTSVVATIPVEVVRPARS